VRLLLSKGADAKAKDGGYGRTALEWPVHNGSVDVMPEILSNKTVASTIPMKDFEALLWQVSKWNREEDFRLLLMAARQRPDFNPRICHQILLHAVKSGFDRPVRVLLDSGCVSGDEKNEPRGRTPLSWAAASGNTEIVRLLLEKGKCDVNARDPENDQTP
jgi:ankyrin repeat protein